MSSKKEKVDLEAPDYKVEVFGFANQWTGEVLPFQTGMSLPLSPGIDCQAAKDGLTEQHHESECNINNIVKRFMKTGDMTLLQKRKSFFMDLSQIPSSYQDALQFVGQVAENFEALPAVVRAAYENDPQKFMEAVKIDPEGVFQRAGQLLQPDVSSAPQNVSEVPPVVSKEAQPVKDEKK